MPRKTSPTTSLQVRPSLPVPDVLASAQAHRFAWRSVLELTPGRDVFLTVARLLQLWAALLKQLGCCAGFFLFAVQPFKLGDRVAVSYSTPASGGRAPWFEGVCEKVDLRCVPAVCFLSLSPHQFSSHGGG